MKQFLATLWFGIREPFEKVNYIFLFFVLILVMLTLFVFVPVWTVPDNTLATQLDIFMLRDYVVIILLSSLYSLFITMQIYIIHQTKRIEGLGTAVGGGLGALFAGIAGTAFCAACLAPLFALFGIGFGSVIFVLKYRLYFVILIILLMLFAIYLSARKINKICSSC